MGGFGVHHVSRVLLLFIVVSVFLRFGVVSLGVVGGPRLVVFVLFNSFLFVAIFDSFVRFHNILGHWPFFYGR